MIVLGRRSEDVLRTKDVLGQMQKLFWGRYFCATRRVQLFAIQSTLFKCGASRLCTSAIFLRLECSRSVPAHPLLIRWQGGSESSSSRLDQGCGKLPVPSSYLHPIFLKAPIWSILLPLQPPLPASVSSSFPSIFTSTLPGTWGFDKIASVL